MQQLPNLEGSKRVVQVGAGANQYGSGSILAGGCTDNPECEARLGNNWKLEVVMRYREYQDPSAATSRNRE